MSCFITVCFDVHDSFAPEMIFFAFHHLLQRYYFHKIKSSASVRQHFKLKEKRKDKLDRMKRIMSWMLKPPKILNTKTNEIKLRIF